MIETQIVRNLIFLTIWVFANQNCPRFNLNDKSLSLSNTKISFMAII